MMDVNSIKHYGVMPTILFTLVHVVNAGEYCYSSGQYEYCSGYCCSSGSTECCTEDWGWIAGVVIGCIIIISIIGTIIFLICSKMKAKKVQTVHVQNTNRIQQSRHIELNNYRRNMQSTNNYGTQYNVQQYPSQGLPAPPPYSQLAAPNQAYVPPPPYPGSPLPPQYSTISPRNNYTTLGNSSSDPVYPPPPVS